MTIKKLQKGDIKCALELVWSVFEEFEAPDYSEQGINEFKEFISFEAVMDKIDKGEISFWGYYTENVLVGIIATRGKSHICLLFVKKEYHRRGIARALFQTVTDVCRRDKSVEKITVNSSPYAVETYRRLGFIDTDIEKTVNGIRFTPMEYRLVGL